MQEQADPSPALLKGRHNAPRQAERPGHPTGPIHRRLTAKCFVCLHGSAGGGQTRCTVTNYGALAILALPKMPERQLRLLIALETVSPSGTSWRSIGTKLLASKAGLSPATIRVARNELVHAGTIAYVPGNGRGHLSTFRLLFAIKGDNESDYLSGNKGADPPPERCSNGSRKGDPKKPVTSGNENTGLSTSGLRDFGLAPHGRANPPGPPRGHLEDPAPLGNLGTLTAWDRPHSETCRARDHKFCVMSWCACTCHRARSLANLTTWTSRSWPAA
jgi:hypothetical protein